MFFNIKLCFVENHREISLYLHKEYATHSHYLRKKESEVAQSCLTLCDPMGCSLPGSSVHGIFPARIVECVTISLSLP